MLYLLIALVLGTLIYIGRRVVFSNRPKARVIGPDDDPEFLRQLGQ